MINFLNLFKSPFPLFLLFVSLFLGCQTPSSKTGKSAISNTDVEISPDNSLLQYSGRIDFSNPQSPVFFWAGTSVKARFEGNSIQVKLKDISGKNYYNAIIDGDIDNRIVIDCEPGQTVYTVSVADSIEKESHTIEIVRRTDPRSPATEFQGFVLEPGKKLFELPSDRKMRIEFFGNSITSAHGVLDESRKNNDDLSTWDNTMSYAAMTARHLNAEYHCISMSGIGVVKSWYPLIMPQIYNRLDPNDPESEWGFSQWTPDIVVVNLFQNDSWLIKNHQPETMITAYTDFIRTLRTHYPDVEIICALGNMDITRSGSPWPGYVKTAVSRMNQPPFSDAKIHSLIFPFKNTGGHPTVSEQKAMADLLVEFIEDLALRH